MYIYIFLKSTKRANVDFYLYFIYIPLNLNFYYLEYTNPQASCFKI